MKAGSTDSKQLTRLVSSFGILLSSALEMLQNSWTSYLRPAIREERKRLDELVKQLEKEGDEYPDDYLTDDYYENEQTEQILSALYAVAVYHIFEQHMIYVFYRWATHLLGQKLNPKPQLFDVVISFRAAWSIDPEALKSWPKINELGLVANCAKHGEGKACEDLRELRPDWFKSRDQAVIPLGAFGVEIPVDYVESAIVAVKDFLAELQTQITAAPRS
jgi:hypothetical protein